MYKVSCKAKYYFTNILLSYREIFTKDVEFSEYENFVHFLAWNYEEEKFYYENYLTFIDYMTVVIHLVPKEEEIFEDCDLSEKESEEIIYC
jgi:hypothetical protein